MARKGLIDSLNYIWEHGSPNYQKFVPVIDESTGIETFTAPLLEMPEIFNEFAGHLLNKIVYTQFENRAIRNPLKILEGDTMPLGQVGEEIFINPAIGRDYDPNDFAGLLKKYEADIKVQYMGINFDKQYPVTIIRQSLKKAFTSWNDLGAFISRITQSLYNGYNIDEYNNTKAIVTRAYLSNAVQMKVIKPLTSKENILEFSEIARTAFLDFQTPCADFNAWKKVGGYGRSIETMCEADDIVFLVRNDIRSKMDVQALASAFNVDKADLMGRIIGVKDFDVKDRLTGKKLLDGSKIYGIMCDRAWFRIKTQDEYMDKGENANNRSINYYLNEIKEFNYSFFANALCFVSEEPEVNITDLKFTEDEITIKKEDTKSIDVIVTPANGNKPKIEYTTEDNNVIIQALEDTDRQAYVQAVSVGDATITATAGNVTKTITVHVVD